MLSSTFDEMVEFIETAYPARGYIVPCLQGPSGIGKTAAVNHVADKLGAKRVVKIVASQILPNEVSGITMPVPESKAMEIFDHYKLGSLEDGDFLFFDELLEADQLVLSACLTLIESRELMSGRKLPDVMIVAATNPTIKPNMLKENIRQRFVWREFEFDCQGCREYIERTCGFDIGVHLMNKISCTGNEYNILTPRSMTKMCQWMCEAGDDKKKAEAIGIQINSVWKNQLGTMLYEQYMKKIDDPDRFVRNAIRNAVGESDFDDEWFEQTSIAEMMEILQRLPEWHEIQEALSNMEMEEPETVDEVMFRF